jgi:protein-disulfide isomerase
MATTLKAPITPRDHRLGAPDAPVTLVEYGDYQCPFCAAAQPVIHQLFQAFGPDLALAYRHFPLTEVHPHAGVAAQAAEFAGARGAFWQMHEALFANQPRLSPPVIFAIAASLNLSQAALQEALATGVHLRKIQEDFLGGVRSGVNGTPTFFVNGVRHDGAYAFEELAAAIAAARPAAPPSRSLGEHAHP